VRYLLYDLVVSADHALPGLEQEAAGPAPDLVLQVGSHSPESQGPAARIILAREGDAAPPALTLLRTLDGGWFHLNYADGTRFSVSAQGDRIGSSWVAPLTLEDTGTYLYGPVLGFTLRLRGVTCLHASAIAVDGQAILLCGPAGAGKSTTAAALVARGHPALSDDVSALDGTEAVTVRAAYPHLRLWPDSVSSLFGAGDHLPPLTPNWDKRFLDLASQDGAFHNTSLPVAAVFVLAGREEQGAPRLEPLPAGEALLALVANTYMSALPDLPAQGRDLERYAALVRRVPVVRVVPHADPARLDQLCALLEDHVRAGVSHA
jgi:hypothetical protein